MHRLTLALLFMLSACASAHAEPAAGFAALTGSWAGRGQFQGAPSEVNARFEPLFDGGAWSLDIDVRFVPQGRPPMRFQGRAAYVLRDGAPAGGAWIDSFANAYEITPRFEAGVLVVDWGEGQVAGRSQYSIEPDGDLLVEDFTRAADGAWRQFARAELQKAQ